MLKSLSDPDGVEIRNCEFGKGLFARRDFCEKEIIGLVTGRILDDPDYCSEYCIELDDQFSLEPFAPFRYLNHSCHPNAEMTSYEDGTFADIFIVAVEPIPADAEILIDYAWPAESAAPCQCESSECRGWIVAEEELGLVDRGE
ncbi:MAG: SET domain-containing protein [Planctomycetota bacterium]|nr:SET domain-containing protein [Planctomycetota bacterium]